MGREQLKNQEMSCDVKQFFDTCSSTCTTFRTAPLKSLYINSQIKIINI